MRNSPSDRTTPRRSFLHTTSLLAAAATVLPAMLLAQKRAGKEQEDDVSTNEDLMREHGILKRVLLIYDEVIRRIDTRQDFPPQTVTDSANIIRRFIEDYHEKLEEEHLFPRFRKAHKLVDLVDVLYEQHQAGRRVTDRVLSTVASLKTADDRKRLSDDLRSFIRMYAPHESREDTVLFPALHKIVSRQEYEALGKQFDEIEHKTFGGDGFDIYLDKVAGIEKQLGIYDLAQFTPR
jgi:hemerythrin-like domain-containing protein